MIITYREYVRLMAGTSRVGIQIPRHFRTKGSRVNGVSDAFSPSDDARNGCQGAGARRPQENIYIAVTAEVLRANVGYICDLLTLDP